jgi:hypothetical protein
MICSHISSTTLTHNCFHMTSRAPFSLAPALPRVLSNLASSDPLACCPRLRWRLTALSYNPPPPGPATAPNLVLCTTCPPPFDNPKTLQPPPPPPMITDDASQHPHQPALHHGVTCCSCSSSSMSWTDKPIQIWDMDSALEFHIYLPFCLANGRCLMNCRIRRDTLISCSSTCTLSGRQTTAPTVAERRPIIH